MQHDCCTNITNVFFCCYFHFLLNSIEFYAICNENCFIFRTQYVCIICVYNDESFNKIFFRLWMICYKLTVFNSKDSFHFSFFEANRVDNCIYNSKTRRAEKKNKNGIQIQIQTKPACNTDSTMRSELRIVHIQLQVSQMR